MWEVSLNSNRQNRSILLGCISHDPDHEDLSRRLGSSCARWRTGRSRSSTSGLLETDSLLLISQIVKCRMSRRLRLLRTPVVPPAFALSTNVCDLSLSRRADTGLISIGADLDVFVIGASLRPSMRTTATKANHLLFLVLANSMFGLTGMTPT